MNRRWYLFLVTLFVLSWAAIAGADPNIDACYNLIKAGDYPRAIESGKKAIQTAPRLADSYYCLGDAYRRSGEIKLALHEMQKAEQLTSDKASLMYIYNQLGIILSKTGDQEQALQQYNRYLSLARELGRKDDEASAMSNIALIYKARGQYDLALQNHEDSLKLRSDENENATTYNNIAMLYSDKGDYDKAIDYLMKSVAIHEKTGDYHSLAMTTLNLGDTYRLIKSYDKAGDSLFDGLAKIRKVKDAYWEGVAHQYISWLYSDMGNIPLARTWMKAALDIFTRVGAQDDAQAAKVGLEGLMQPRPYAGIEIGAKGVKSSVLVMTPQPDNTYNVNEPYRRSINTTIFAGVKEKGVFEAQAIEETAKAVKELYDIVTTTHKVAPGNVFVVGSSAVAKAGNRDKLVAKVRELTGQTMHFITKEEEVLYNVVGSIPADKTAKALSIDIGSGNTKIGYLDRSGGKNQTVATEIALGTVSLTDLAIKAGDDPKALSNAADKAIKAELVPRIKQDMQKHPGYRNRRPVYLAGGIAWAITTFVKPGNADDFPKITQLDVDKFIAGIKKTPDTYLNPSLAHVSNAETRQWAEKQVQSVKDVFTPENMLTGAKLLKSVMAEMKIKEAYFARWGSWLAGKVYLQAYEAEEQAAGRQ